MFKMELKFDKRQVSDSVEFNWKEYKKIVPGWVTPLETKSCNEDLNKQENITLTNCRPVKKVRNKLNKTKKTLSPIGCAINEKYY